MWYQGSESGDRGSTSAGIGHASSPDGLRWTEHAGNPILTVDDLPWGRSFEGLFVLYDFDEHVYKGWFSASTRWDTDESTGSRLLPPRSASPTGRPRPGGTR